MFEEKEKKMSFVRSIEEKNARGVTPKRERSFLMPKAVKKVRATPNLPQVRERQKK